MTALVLLGIAAIGYLAISSAASSPLVVEPPPSPPPSPPPPAPPPKKVATTPPPQGDYSFFNYAAGTGIEPDSFLNWAPGAVPGTAQPEVATPSAPAGPTLPRAGEKWEQVWTLNRPLSYFELSAAKSAFSSQMHGQTLDAALQRTGTPVTVTVTSTFTADATAPIPVGQTLKKMDIVATLASARRIA